MQNIFQALYNKFQTLYELKKIFFYKSANCEYNLDQLRMWNYQIYQIWPYSTQVNLKPTLKNIPSNCNCLKRVNCNFEVTSINANWLNLKCYQCKLFRRHFSNEILKSPDKLWILNEVILGPWCLQVKLLNSLLD